MTEHSYDDAERALKTTDTLPGTFEVGGEVYPLDVHEPTLDQLERIEEDLTDEADEVEAIREMVDRYLEAPDVDPGAIGVSKLRALFDGMRGAWENTEAIDEAEEAMPLDEGNRRRRTSRR